MIEFAEFYTSVAHIERKIKKLIHSVPLTDKKRLKFTSTKLFAVQILCYHTRKC